MKKFENESEITEKEIIQKERPTLKITDFAGNLDDLQNITYQEYKIDYLEKSSHNIFKTIAYYLNLTNPLEWVFIIFFCTILTLVLFFFDLVLSWGIEKRLDLCSSSNAFVNFLGWVLSSIILLLIATSVGYFISADSEGSGIPEVKTVISGISISRYFSFEAFVGKTLGLFAALVGGASTGKVGPFVHLSAIVCTKLLKIKNFSKLNSSSSMRNAMIGAAAAAGITLALGTPMGGVIFSLEVTSSIYLVSNLSKAFACATICTLISKFLNSLVTNKNTQLFQSPDQLTPINDFMDTFFFVILGIISGLIGSLLATFVSKLVYIRRKSSLKILNNRFYFAFTVALIVSIITFIIKPLMIFDRYMLSYIFNKTLPKEIVNLRYLNHPGEGMLLFVIFCFKFMLTVICLGINMPAGIFAPFFLIGAYLGRCYGHVIRLMFNVSEESIYAMVGAACVMSGATHSISSSIIIYELTGQSSFLVPMLFACLIANITAQFFSTSFFDVLLLMKNLPHLPSIKSHNLYLLTAESMMTQEFYPIPISNFNYINSLQLVFNLPKKYRYSIPLIDSNGVIIYTLKPKKLVKYLFHLFEDYKLNYEIDVQNKLNCVIKFIRRKLGKKEKTLFTYVKYKFKKMLANRKDREIMKLNKINEEEIIRNKLNEIKESKILFIT